MNMNCYLLVRAGVIREKGIHILESIWLDTNLWSATFQSSIFWFCFARRETV